MKARLASVLVVITLLIVCIFTGVAAADENVDQPVQQQVAADPVVVNCLVLAGIQNAKVVCTALGQQVLNTTIDLPVITQFVTLPPLPRVTQTVRIRLPGSVETVRVPGPTIRATETVPGPTNTVTAKSKVTKFVTVAPRPDFIGPTTVVSTTVSQAGPTPRQSEPTPDTLDPGGDGLIPREPGPVVVAGIGLGILAALAALILLGMYGGYYIGYKDSDKADANFFRSLLNNSKE